MEQKFFIYNGFTFKPVRKLLKNEVKDLSSFSKHIFSDRNLGMTDFICNWQKKQYSHDEFYEASGDSEMELFRCVETGFLYVPCEHELFGFK